MHGEKWVDLGNAVVARLETKGSRFEVLVDPDKALEFKKGGNIDIRDVLMGYVIFEDAHRGKKAPEEKLKVAFETDDIFTIASLIIRSGEVQLTAEQRKSMIEEKKKRIIHIISRNSINPQTGLPHPPARIEAAIEEAKVPINPFRDPDEQAKEVVEALRPILPIRMETTKLAVKIPPPYSAKGYSIIERFGTITKDEWGTDGSWICVIEIPAGLRVEFIERVNGFTKGKAQVKTI
ncbi:MAG: ribosome assembly factor SBDS [Promethearchaeati archaeon SRVP18_Atabeyarchaeia-1]